MFFFVVSLQNRKNKAKVWEMEFLCKQFALNHSRSSMKVGTDSIVLASLMNRYFENREETRTVLDVGTGCGILALCMAQVFPYAEITAIDIDGSSIEECGKNFSLSKWNARLNAQQVSFEDFACRYQAKFDFIISNPPYFSNSLLSPDKTRSNARHNNSLSLENFVSSSCLLSKEGTKTAVILPCKETKILEELFECKGFGVEYRCNISPKEQTGTKRMVSLFSRQPAKTREEYFYIRNINNEYSEEYRQITQAFLL